MQVHPSILLGQYDIHISSFLYVIVDSIKNNIVN